MFRKVLKSEHLFFHIKIWLWFVITSVVIYFRNLILTHISVVSGPDITFKIQPQRKKAFIHMGLFTYYVTLKAERGYL